MNARIFVLLAVIAIHVAACATAGRPNARQPSSIEGTDPEAWEYATVPTERGDVHYWRLGDNGFNEAIDETDARERAEKDAACPAGMVGVSGRMKRDDPKRGPVEYLQESACTDWMDPPNAYPRRCARFDEAKWKAIAATLPTKEMKPFCIDRYEYPNVKGANPAIDLNWYEAKALCEKDGKRLCSEDEWTFACEGSEALPYAYGFVRSAETCNIDKPWMDFSNKGLEHRATANRGLAQLWKGEPSGSRPACKSPFGVYDMTGNVDEWTVTTSRSGYKSILKGGYWSTVRSRCRPSTRAHNEEHTFYQQGFRCCVDQ